ILGPIVTNAPSVTVCHGNLGEPTTNNFSTLPGQHYFLVGPEVRITSINTVGNDVQVKYLPANNTNLLYRLERATVLSNNTTYTAVTGFVPGTNAIVTVTETGGATNKPGRFYRVLQRPVCP